jgi:hypothetical protein
MMMTCIHETIVAEAPRPKKKEQKGCRETGVEDKKDM